MAIQRFEDIIAWQKSKRLTTEIYTAFRNIKDYAFKKQIERASVSVMNNIAEGFERKTDKDFSNFLFIAKGSCGEVRSMLYLAKDLSYVEDERFKSLLHLSEEVSRLLSGFITSLK